MPNCVMSLSCLPCKCRAFLQARFATTKSCMQVKERLNVLGGIPRQVFADSTINSLADAEEALDNLEWEKLVSGFTPDAVGVPDTASHRLLLILAPAWRSGEHSCLVMSSTAVM